jgi:hypothetical protein
MVTIVLHELTLVNDVILTFSILMLKGIILQTHVKDDVEAEFQFRQAISSNGHHADALLHLSLLLLRKVCGYNYVFVHLPGYEGSHRRGLEAADHRMQRGMSRTPSVSHTDTTEFATRRCSSPQGTNSYFA